MRARELLFITISATIMALLTGCMANDDVPGEATSYGLQQRAQPEVAEQQGVPSEPMRATSRRNVRALSGTPALANSADDPPPPAPLDRSDARLDQIIDARSGLVEDAEARDAPAP